MDNEIGTEENVIVSQGDWDSLSNISHEDEQYRERTILAKHMHKLKSTINPSCEDIQQIVFNTVVSSNLIQTTKQSVDKLKGRIKNLESVVRQFEGLKERIERLESVVRQFEGLKETIERLESPTREENKTEEKTQHTILHAMGRIVFIIVVLLLLVYIGYTYDISGVRAMFGSLW